MGGVAESTQGVLFELSDAFGGEAEFLSDVLESERLPTGEPVAESNDAPFPSGETGNSLSETVGYVGQLHFCFGFDRLVLFDEVRQDRAVLTHGFVKRHRRRGLEGCMDLAEGQSCGFGEFVWPGRSPELLGKVRLRLPDERKTLADVGRDTKHPGLFRQCSADCLANPPGGIRRELKASSPVEFLDGPDQPQVALLHEVEQFDAVGRQITSGVGDDQPKVGGQEPFLGGFTTADLLLELPGCCGEG